MRDPAKLHAQLLEGLALQQSGQLAQAQNAYRQVLKQDPKNFDALHLLGVIAAQNKDFTESVKLIGRAITINPKDTTAHYNRGIALDELRQYAAAIASYDKAIKLKPDHAVAYNNRGAALNFLKRHAESIASFDQAIALQPDYAEAYNNRGHTRADLGQLEGALADFDEALRLKPDYPYLPGIRLHTKLRLCDWRNLDQDIAVLERHIASGAPVTMPWLSLGFTNAPALQYTAAKTWATETHPPRNTFGDFPKPPHPQKAGAKIRVGYFSMDFRDHPVAQLTARLFELHDRSAFEVFAFSYGPDTKDDVQKRLRGAFDAFIDVREKSDEDIAALARHMRIDIAVDLAGYTTDARPGIMALRAAPLQVSYLGYAASMAVPYIDYIIADRHVIPEGGDKYFSEKIAYLPCYQASDNKRAIADRTFSREELGLPPTGFVFCCFNTHHKILPAVFDVWMRILRQVEGSVLWLSEANPTAVRNLGLEAERRGVNKERLVFAKRVAMADHLARQRAADLSLDTLPFNAHTTASDALLAGLPILTCAGNTYAGRVAASLLYATDLPELVTSTPAEFETRAVTLAKQPDQLRALRDRLHNTRESCLLFDSVRFTKHIEDAYRRMLERYHGGLPADHIHGAP